MLCPALGHWVSGGLATTLNGQEEKESSQENGGGVIGRIILLLFQYQTATGYTNFHMNN